MSRELMRLGAPFRQPEWSALALIEAPEKVRDAYAAFAAAGAEVLTTDAYAVVPYHLGADRFERDGHRLVALSAQLAREVADQHLGVRVGGCLPPALGSYRPDRLATEPDVARAILEVLVAAQSPFVDVWLIETMSSIDEAMLSIDVATHDPGGLPVWVAFTVDDADGTRLRSGEPVIDAVHVAEAAGVAAVAFNCSQPEALAASVRSARSVSELPIGVYANVLHEHSSDGANEIIHDRRNDATPEAYAVWAERWVEAGATIVGGCCGTTSEHIAALANHLN